MSKLEGPDTSTDLAAAAKTIAVLKRKIHALYNDGVKSGIHQQLEAARRRDLENRQRREMIEVRASDLEAYNERLVAEVDAQTKAIRDILDNVTFGFLIVDHSGKVQPGHTVSCHRLLGSECLEGRHIADVLGLEHSPKQMLELCMDQIFEDILPENVSLEVLQSRFHVGSRILHLEPRTIRGANGEVVGVLMTISDVTRLEDTQQENETNRFLISILKQKEPFRMFIVDARLLIARARDGVATGDDLLVRRMIHTLKGNAASYGLKQLTALIHEVEECAIDATVITRIEDALRSFLEMHREVLEIDFDAVINEDFVVSASDIRHLERLVNAANIDGGARLARWTATVLQKPVHQLLGPIEEFTRRLASRLEKRVDLRIEGRDLMVHYDTIRPICSQLPHLVRNAIDHGIEGVGERGEKPTTGRISIEFLDVDGEYQVVVSDDGRGIDIAKLSRTALERGLVTQTELDAMPFDERTQLVFVDSLSSAEVATDVSGRGAGMSSVKAEVELVGGRVEIKSRLGQGTTFVVRVPKPDGLAENRAA